MSALPEGFIPHDGGLCPMNSNLPVTIVTRGGEQSHWARAGSVVWRYGTWIDEIGESMPKACEVIAYHPTQQEPR
jgi:hypothetical protein